MSLSQCITDSSRNRPANTLAWRPFLNAGVKVRQVAGEAILLDRQNRHVHQLDPVGTRILGLCDGTRAVRDIVDVLLREFDVEQDQLTADVSELLDRMKALGLLAETPPNKAATIKQEQEIENRKTRK